MSTRQQAAALPISVLSGFLGSGKTTLLRRALGSPSFSDTAVVINEIGEIGLDHHLVETVDGPILELPGGCICCAVREDLAATLRALIVRREEGRGPAFQRVVVETTGLADPGPILYTLAAEPRLESRLRLDRVVTTVDATTGETVLQRYAEATSQVAVADRLVITKADLKPVTRELIAGIDALNAGAERVLATEIGSVGAMLWGSAAEARLPRLPATSGGHTHGVATYALALRAPCSRLEFARALGGLAQDRGDDLLRVKGLMRFSDRPDRVAFVQAAQHALYPPIWLDERRQQQDESSRLQFVVRDISSEEILARFAFAGAEPLSRSAITNERKASCWT